MPCQDTFDHHDVDNKGFLTKTELRESVRTLGHNPTEQELWRLLAQVWPRVTCHVLHVTCHVSRVTRLMCRWMWITMEL